MTLVHIGADSLWLGSPANAVAARWWTTRFGVLLASAGDEPLDAVAHADITRGASLHGGGSWAPPQPVLHPRQAVLEPARMPRALRWATALRALAGAVRDDVSEVTFEVRIDDAEGAVDACRAAALLGWHAVQPRPAIAGLADGWRDRRPWAALREAPPSQRTLIAETARLPSKVRLGSALGDAPRLQIGDEMLAFAEPGDFDDAGTREFELVWSADGRVTLDLLIDEQWRPLLPIEHGEWRDPPNALAASEYASLAYWSKVLDAIQCQWIAPLSPLPGSLHEETP